MVVLVRLTISLTITDHTKRAKAVDQLPKQWFLQETQTGLVIEIEDLYWMRGWVYVQEVVAYPKLYEDILRKAHYSRFTVHPSSMKMYLDLCQS